jgi:hypothetical protein
MYQNQIASETLLVETAVQNKFKIKFSRLLSLSSPVPAVTLSVKSTTEAKMLSHYGWSLQRRKKC